MPPYLAVIFPGVTTRHGLANDVDGKPDARCATRPGFRLSGGPTEQPNMASWASDEDRGGTRWDRIRSVVWGKDGEGGAQGAPRESGVVMGPKQESWRLVYDPTRRAQHPKTPTLRACKASLWARVESGKLRTRAIRERAKSRPCLQLRRGPGAGDRRALARLVWWILRNARHSTGWPGHPGRQERPFVSSDDCRPLISRRKDLLAQ